MTLLTSLQALHDEVVLLASIGNVLRVMADADRLHLPIHVRACALACHAVQVPQRYRAVLSARRHLPGTHSCAVSLHMTCSHEKQDAVMSLANLLSLSKQSTPEHCSRETILEWLSLPGRTISAKA